MRDQQQRQQHCQRVFKHRCKHRCGCSSGRGGWLTGTCRAPERCQSNGPCGSHPHRPVVPVQGRAWSTRSWCSWRGRCWRRCRGGSRARRRPRPTSAATSAQRRPRPRAPRCSPSRWVLGFGFRAAAVGSLGQRRWGHDSRLLWPPSSKCFGSGSGTCQPLPMSSPYSGAVLCAWCTRRSQAIPCTLVSIRRQASCIPAPQVPGGWHDMKTSIATTVLQFLLGGGGSFSSGGPGALHLPPLCLALCLRRLASPHVPFYLTAASCAQQRTHEMLAPASAALQFALTDHQHASRQLLGPRPTWSEWSAYVTDGAACAAWLTRPHLLLPQARACTRGCTRGC